MYALRNVPSVTRMFWDSAPRCVALGLTFRLITALLPLGALLLPGSLSTVWLPTLPMVVSSRNIFGSWSWVISFWRAFPSH